MCATAHAGKGTQVKHCMVRRDATFSSSPFASTVLPVPSSPDLEETLESRPWADAQPGLIQAPGKAWCQGSAHLCHLPAALLLAGATGTLPYPGPPRGQLQLPAPAHRKPLSQIGPRQQPIPEYKRWGDHKRLLNKARKSSRFKR